MGPQLDANHDADASEIKEITQVVSALAQNGNTAHLAQEVYENLASTIKNAALPYEKYLGNDTNDLYNYMSRKFIDKMSKSDNVSLAKNILESLPEDLQVPFSNQNFFQAFVKDVISRMNNEFITRYYRGIGAVLNPSHDIVKMFEDVNGNIIKQEDLAKIAFTDYKLNRINYKQNIVEIYDYDEMNHGLIADDINVVTKTKKWRNDPSKSNTTYEFSFINKPKEIFELVKDLEDTQYSIHFKTTKGNLTEIEKQRLIGNVHSFLPVNAKLST